MKKLFIVPLLLILISFSSYADSYKVICISDGDLPYATSGSAAVLGVNLTSQLNTMKRKLLDVSPPAVSYDKTKGTVVCVTAKLRD